MTATVPTATLDDLASLLHEHGTLQPDERLARVWAAVPALIAECRSARPRCTGCGANGTYLGDVPALGRKPYRMTHLGFCRIGQALQAAVAPRDETAYLDEPMVYERGDKISGAA